jgi:hypothetical protein
MPIRQLELASIPNKGDTLYTKEGIYILHTGSSGLGYFKGVGGEYVHLDRSQLQPKGPKGTWTVLDKGEVHQQPQAPVALPKGRGLRTYVVTVNYHGEIHKTTVYATDEEKAKSRAITKLAGTTLKTGPTAQKSDYARVRGYFNTNPTRITVQLV